MEQSGTPYPQWASPEHCERHFRKHASLLGIRTITGYELSARVTMRIGTRFTFQDRDTGELRVGYYERRTNRFTALDASESIIHTHFSPGQRERYVRLLPSSTYQR